MPFESSMKNIISIKTITKIVIQLFIENLGGLYLKFLLVGLLVLLWVIIAINLEYFLFH